MFQPLPVSLDHALKVGAVQLRDVGMGTLQKTELLPGKEEQRWEEKEKRQDAQGGTGSTADRRPACPPSPSSSQHARCILLESLQQFKTLSTGRQAPLGRAQKGRWTPLPG